MRFAEFPPSLPSSIFLSDLDDSYESHGAATPFTSLAWLAQVNQHLEQDERYGLIYDQTNQVVAWLTVGRRSSRFSRSHPSLGFNEPSSAKLASVTTEYNGLFGSQSPDALSRASSEILKLLITRKDWEEIRITAISEQELQSFKAACQQHNLLMHIHSEQFSYSTDLTASLGQSIESLFSANTRQQLRRMARKVEKERGPLTIQTAETSGEALAWLSELAELHKARWNTNGETAGFVNPGFVEFHRSLIESTPRSYRVELVKVIAGENTLAVLHFLRSRDSVFFNMSGIDYQRFEMYKPGLLAHWMAMEHYRQRGLKTYDFMGGTNRYKESLSTTKFKQYGILIRRPKLKFLLEHWARAFKRKNQSKE